PFVDLLLPVDLGATRGVVLWVKFIIELCYFIFAIHTFGKLPLWNTVLRCILVLGAGNALLIFLMSKAWQ
ncbi:MAG TPA: hypothetical protein VIV63_05665, partial [Steroidobacteraceae bacterium]